MGAYSSSVPIGKCYRRAGTIESATFAHSAHSSTLSLTPKKRHLAVFGELQADEHAKFNRRMRPSWTSSWQ
ncbi:hypothetical protein VTO73DRAFT_14048 [Trametes versicolor]